jgi:hypothetical protein
MEKNEDLTSSDWTTEWAAGPLLAMRLGATHAVRLIREATAGPRIPGRTPSETGEVSGVREEAARSILSYAPCPCSVCATEE